MVELAIIMRRDASKAVRGEDSSRCRLLGRGENLKGLAFIPFAKPQEHGFIFLEGNENLDRVVSP
jgi:hypothetical protein